MLDFKPWKIVYTPNVYEDPYYITKQTVKSGFFLTHNTLRNYLITKAGPLYWVVYESILSHNHLAKKTNSELPNCFPSVDLVAYESGLSKRKTIEIISELEKRGYLLIQKGASHTPNNYYFPCEPFFTERLVNKNEADFFVNLAKDSKNIKALDIIKQRLKDIKRQIDYESSTLDDEKEIKAYRKEYRYSYLDTLPINNIVDLQELLQKKKEKKNSTEAKIEKAKREIKKEEKKETKVKQKLNMSEQQIDWINGLLCDDEAYERYTESLRGNNKEQEETETKNSISEDTEKDDYGDIDIF